MKFIGFVLLGIAAATWLILIIAGMIAAFPFGLIGLVVIIGVGFLLARVILDRLSNKEDDYYSKNVDK